MVEAAKNAGLSWGTSKKKHKQRFEISVGETTTDLTNYRSKVIPRKRMLLRFHVNLEQCTKEASSLSQPARIGS